MLKHFRMYLSSSLFIFLFYYCTGDNSTSPPIDKIEDEEESIVVPVKLAEPVSIDSLLKTVSDLTGENIVNINGIQKIITSRQFNHEGNEDAAIYLTNRLKYYGLDVKHQAFYHGKLHRPFSQGQNILGIKKGKQENIFIIISSHYDSYSYNGTLPTGADDNASGCGVVIEAARILSKMETEYSIIFALWDEEEIGLVGSAFYADSVYSMGMDIKYVINLDMVAWDGDNDSRVRLDYYDPGKYSNSIISLADSLNIVDSLGLTFVKSTERCESDACSFAIYYETLGVSEYWGEENEDFYPYYHSNEDRIEHFNLKYYENISKLVIRLLASAAR